jgi:hypothetical protein
MAVAAGPRSAAEIRDYLLRQLNSALRRPGLYGGEMAVRLLLDHLCYAAGQDEAWAGETRAMRSRGAFTSTGVTGAFRALIPGAYESGMASVYAEFARSRGWLAADRVLTAGEYASMRAGVEAWVTENRVLREVTDAFGPPSVLLGGSSPRRGKTLGYLTERAEDPVVFFHLWNGTDPQPAPARPPLHDEPVLLAVRCGCGPFARSFAFTPEGSQRRPGE